MQQILLLSVFFCFVSGFSFFSIIFNTFFGCSLFWISHFAYLLESLLQNFYCQSCFMYPISVKVCWYLKHIRMKVYIFCEQMMPFLCLTSFTLVVTEIRQSSFIVDSVDSGSTSGIYRYIFISIKLKPFPQHSQHQTSVSTYL